MFFFFKKNSWSIEFYRLTSHWVHFGTQSDFRLLGRRSKRWSLCRRRSRTTNCRESGGRGWGWEIEHKILRIQETLEKQVTRRRAKVKYPNHRLSRIHQLLRPHLLIVVVNKIFPRQPKEKKKKKSLSGVFIFLIQVFFLYYKSGLSFFPS